MAKVLENQSQGISQQNASHSTRVHSESFLKRKYERWGEFLKLRRQAKFRSAREFCSKEDLGISYPQYSRYEAGDQLPSLEHALQLCRLLSIPTLEGILEWNRAQMGESKAGTEVDQLLAKVRASAIASQESAAGAINTTLSKNSGSKKLPLPPEAVSFDDVVVFNRSHLKVFESDSRYRDIFTYVNSFAPEWITADEISKVLAIEPEKIDAMLEQLNDLGVILVGGGKCRATKSNFYFPDDPEFFNLRNANVEHNVSNLMKQITPESIEKRESFRGLISREFSPEQFAQLLGKVEELMNAGISFPQPKDPDRIYSICVLMGERFRRPQAQTAIDGQTSQPGLKTQLNANETSGSNSSTGLDRKSV